MQKERRQMFSTWENALGLLRTEIPEEYIPVFLAQLGCSQYSSWQIGSLWGLTAYAVTSYRRALCRDHKELLPEVRHMAADTTLLEVGRKESAG